MLQLIDAHRGSSMFYGVAEGICHAVQSSVPLYSNVQLNIINVELRLYYRRRTEYVGPNLFFDLMLGRSADPADRRCDRGQTDKRTDEQRDRRADRQTK